MDDPPKTQFVAKISAIEAIMMFKEFDQNNNGELSRSDLVAGLRGHSEFSMKLGISDPEIQDGSISQFEKIDGNHSETVDVRFL